MSKRVKEKASRTKEHKNKVRTSKKRGPRLFVVINHLVTIRAKLIISFLVPIFFIILLGIRSYISASDGIKSSYEKATTQAINMTSEYLQLGVDTIESLATQYYKDAAIKQYMNGGYEADSGDFNKAYREIHNIIISKQNTDDFIANIYFLSDTVKSITTTKNEIAFNCDEFFKTDFGKTVLENSKKGKWTGDDAYLNEKLGSDYAMRLVRKFEGTFGVMVIDINLNKVTELLDNLQFENTGIVGMITGDGKEILSGMKEKNTNGAFVNSDYYKNTVAGKEENASYYITDQGDKKLFIYSKVGGTGAMICAKIPNHILLSQADSIKQNTIMIVVIACVLAIIIGVLISVNIDGAIKSIINRLKKVAQGDMTVDFHTKRKDEFHILNEEMKNTFSHVKDLIRQVQQLSTEVSDSSGNVAETSEKFLKASEDISRAMNEIEHGVNQQAKDAEECLHQMDNLSGKISIVNTNTKEISKIAEETKDSINEGTLVTQELNNQTKATLKIATTIINEIEALEEKSLSIDKIIGVINEIAKQTNLLSLNASIEAARAGESGRGFAVVANEIRKLAEQSSNSVNEIKKIIADIQERTEKAVATAKEAENVMSLQESAVENTTNSYQMINKNVERLVINLDGILENVHNIEQARVSTLSAIENMSAVLEEIAASSNTVNLTANVQLETVGTLKDTVDSLNRNSENLVKSVDVFKI